MYVCVCVIPSYWTSSPVIVSRNHWLLYILILQGFSIYYHLHTYSATIFLSSCSALAFWFPISRTFLICAATKKSQMTVIFHGEESMTKRSTRCQTQYVNSLAFQQTSHAEKQNLTSSVGKQSAGDCCWKNEHWLPVRRECTSLHYIVFYCHHSVAVMPHWNASTLQSQL